MPKLSDGGFIEAISESNKIVHLEPLDMMGFDFVGRFPETTLGNKYIILIVDYFTCFLFGKAVPDCQGKSAVALLMEIVKQFGWP